MTLSTFILLSEPENLLGINNVIKAYRIISTGCNQQITCSVEINSIDLSTLHGEIPNSC